MTPREPLLAGEGRVLLEAYAPSDEEMAVSVREHPRVSRSLLELAIAIAGERGGGTIPVSNYDIDQARDLVAGNQNEMARLGKELREAKAELVELRRRARA